MGILKRFLANNPNFPKDKKGRLEVIMKVHREISGNDVVKDQHTLDLLLDLIDGETDPFLLDSYVIYYIGVYKPFWKGNKETAKTVADRILAGDGWYIPQDNAAFEHLDEACSNRQSIDAIVEWQKSYAKRL